MLANECLSIFVLLVYVYLLLSLDDMKFNKVFIYLLNKSPKSLYGVNHWYLQTHVFISGYLSKIDVNSNIITNSVIETLNSYCCVVIINNYPTLNSHCCVVMNCRSARMENIVHKYGLSVHTLLGILPSNQVFII